jgi:predicted TPR repeat methyltransferase
MVAKARARAIYDALAVGDVVEHLRTETGVLDLVVAADVFVYLGDLGPVIAAVADRLAPGGLFIFSVEADEGDGFSLRDSLRYAHGIGHITAAAARAGLAVTAMEPAVLRSDRGRPVDGLLVALEPFNAPGRSP